MSGAAASPRASKQGDIIRVLDGAESSRRIDGGWRVTRIEPESGNAVAEKGGKRIICPRGELCALNFEGADGVWELISSEDDDRLRQAAAAWAKLDLSGAKSCIIKYCRDLDPDFAGIETCEDLEAKKRQIEDYCRSSCRLLEIERARTKRKYDAIGSSSALDFDAKDTLLASLERIENELNARKHHLEVLLPHWERAYAAIRSLEEAQKIAP